MHLHVTSCYKVNLSNLKQQRWKANQISAGISFKWSIQGTRAGRGAQERKEHGTGEAWGDPLCWGTPGSIEGLGMIPGLDRGAEMLPERDPEERECCWNDPRELCLGMIPGNGFWE